MNYGHGEFDCMRFVKRQFRPRPLAVPLCSISQIKAGDHNTKDDTDQHAAKIVHDDGDLDG